MFAGDFVDRGQWSVEIMTMLLALKCEFPSTVYLLRGNHGELAHRFRQV